MEARPAIPISSGKRRTNSGLFYGPDVLTGKVVIVTGASRGLGAAMTNALAARGAQVVAAARGLKAQHPPAGAALALAVDVCEPAEVDELARQTQARFGRIDALVNNAGLMAGEIAFLDTTPELWRQILDVNLWGAFLCCRAVAPIMISQGGGVIVNISSGAAVRAGFLNVPYGVSKAGLDRLTLGLGAELKPAGVACVSLSPPVSATETVRRLYADRDVDAWAQPPELTAQALCALLEDDPMRYSGQVVGVREYLQASGLAS